LQSILTQATESCPFSHLNAAYLQDGALVVLPENFQMQQPLHLLFLSTTSNLQNSRNIIIAEQNARGHIFEEHLSFSDQVYFANVQTQIIAKESSCLSYSKLQQQNLNSFHIANVQIHQAKESQVQVQHYSLGSKLARENINSFLEAKGASIDLKGLFLPLNQQHIDINLNIDHLADATSSEASFKGVAAHKSVAVFNGKIEVSDHIKQAIANLQNKNLLLTSDAEINTKPELKIYSNDVKCKHGATIGQIDQQMLFYLRSRGIGAQQAYQLLLLAFIREQLNCLSDNLVTNKIVSAINQVCEEITL
jgi:Fe-S cluster assembly protein SufD